MLESSDEIGAEIFYSIVRKAYSGLADYTKEHEFEKSATNEYINGLVKRNSTIKVLTMSEPRPLKSLYVRVNILKDKITAEQGDTAEELEKFFDRDRRDFGKSRETVDGELIINKLQCFIVLGKPGAGKTTYLRYLTLMMLNQFSQIKNRKLPIFITLREFADTRFALLDFIAQQFDICGFMDTLSFAEKLLSNGECLVLFDGLDEVSQQSDQSGIILKLKNFCDKYHKNQFAISCRVAAYNRWFEKFHDVEMADFNEQQKENFIQNWFHSEPKIAERCWQKLIESPQLVELASVPLLLILLCITYNRRKDFPANRAELYEEAIDALLRDWDATRDITRDEVYKQLSQKYKKSMFSRIAWGTFQENMYFIPERILTKQIEQYIKNLPGFNPKKLEPDSYIVLKAIEAQHGIFVERAKKVHSFAHLTFQEYFTAKYIVDNARDGSLETLVNDYFCNNKWLEVFILTAEMLDNADELLLLIQLKNRVLVDDIPELNTLLQATQLAILSKSSNFKKVSRETFAIFITLAFTLARDSDFFHDRNRDMGSSRSKVAHKSALDLANAISVTYAGALDLALTLDHTHGLLLKDALSYDLDHFLICDLARARARVRELNLDLDLEPLVSYGQNVKNFSIQNIRKVSDYLVGNFWLLKCLYSGAYISQKVREQILMNLFKPVVGRT